MNKKRASTRDKPKIPGGRPRSQSGWKAGLAAFAEASTDAFFLFDANLDMVAVNPAAKRMAPLSKVESGGAIGKNILDHAPELEESGKYQQYRDVIETGRPLVYDHVVEHPELGRRYLNVRAFKVEDGLGLIVGDVTKRKQAEEALREKEEDLRSVFASTQDMVYRLDLRAVRYDYISPVSERVLGYTPEEFMDVGFDGASTLVHPDDLEHLINNMFSLVNPSERHAARTVEYRMRHKTLGYRWMSDSRTVIDDDEGHPVAVVGSLRDVTEQKVAEQALRESERRFQEVLNSSPDMVYWLDLGTGTYDYISPASEKVLGCGVEELRGAGIEHVGSLIHPDDRNGVVENTIALLDSTREESPASTIEYRARHRELGWRWISDTRKVVRDDRGSPVAIVGVARDVTGRTQAEEALRESERRYRDLADLLPMTVFEVDQDGLLTFLNRMGLEASGYDRQDVEKGFEASRLLAPADKERSTANFQSMLGGARSTGTEYTALRKDGTTFPVLIHSNVVMRGGQPVGLRGIGIDLTERRQAEAALRHQEEYFRSLIENSSDLIAVIGADGTLRYESPSVARLTGHQQGERVGGSAFDFVHPDDLPDVAKAFTGLLERPGGSASMELRFRHKDGSWRVMEGTGQNFLHHPAIQGIVINVRDITERKQAEERIGFLSRVVETAPVSVVATDEHANITYVNPATESLFGYGTAELMGGDPGMFNAEPDAERVQREIVDTVRKGGVWRGEILSRRKDGGLFYTGTSVCRLADECGKTIALIGFQEDITERRKAEEALRESEERHRTLFETMVQGVVYYDGEGTPVAMNAAAEKILGPSASGWRLSGRGVRGWAAIREDGSTLPPAEYPLAVAINEGRDVLDVVMGMRSPGGEVRWLETSAIPQFRPGEDRPYRVHTLTEDITERKRAEEELREREAQLRGIFDGAAIGIALSDRKGRPVSINPMLRRMLGYTVTELRRMHYSTFCHPDDPEALGTAIRELASGSRSSYRIEMPYTPKKGAPIWVRLTLSTVRNEAGTLRYFVSMLEDVTERRQAEEAIRESAETLRNVFDNSVDMIYRVNLRTSEYDFVSRACEQVLGYTPEEYMALGFNNTPGLVHPDDLGDLSQDVIRLLTQSGEPSARTVEYRVKHRQLGYRWVSDYRSVVYDEEGTQVAVVGSLRDITERKQAENALRESEEKLRRMFESVSDGVAVADLDGCITELNRRAVEMYGAGSAAEALGKSAFDLIAPSHQELGLAGMRRTIDHGASGPMEMNLVRIDGSEYPAELSASVLRGASGELAGFIAILRDVTERKQAEEELRERLRFESLLSHVSTRFVNLPAIEVDREIGEVLSLLIEHIGVDRSTVFELTDDGTRYRVMHSCAIAEAEPLPDYVGSDLLPYYSERITRGEMCMFSRLDDLPEEAAIDKEILSLGGMRSNLTIPLEAGGSVLGALAFGTLARERTWPHELVQRMQIMAQVIANALVRKRVEEELAQYRFHLEELVEERTRELQRANERLTAEIDERTRMEEALRQSEKRFRTIAEGLPIAVSISRVADGSILYANQHLADVVSGGTVAPDQLLGRSTKGFYADPGVRDRLVKRLAAGEHVHCEELAGKRLDGSEFCVMASIEPVVFEGEEALMIGAYDITERKRMEEEVRAKERWFRALIENSMDFIAVVDAEGVLRYRSPAAAAALGFDKTSSMEGTTLSLVHPDDMPRTSRSLARLLRRPASIARAEVRARRTDGSWRTFEVVGKNLLDDPVVRGIVANFRDITERKRSEKKLRRLYDRERELREQVEAEMGKRVEFTRALAHELKTPLTPVVMSSQILTSKLEDELLLRVAKNIERGASNLNSRIDELLDLARGEVGMLHVRRERVNLLELLQEVMEDVSAVPASREQRLVSKLPPELAEVSADRVRVKQVVMNLLNNAFKYTPEGGRITLRARRDDGNVVVEVRDTGPGIEKEDLKRLFNPYHRIDSDRERLSGLGLGLALCKTLVALHGGSIWVRSRVGKGSTFGFSLPVGQVSV